MEAGGFLSKGFLDAFFKKHILKILLVIDCAYGIQHEEIENE